MKVTVSRLYSMLSTISRRHEDCSFEEYSKKFVEPFGDLLDYRVEIPDEYVKPLCDEFEYDPAAK